MKLKTITKTLQAKFDDFLSSIEDEALRKEVKANTIITGGSIVSMLLKEPVNDYDLYFRTKAVAKRVADYYVAKFLASNKLAHASGGGVEITVRDQEDRIHLSIKSAGIASEGERSDYKYFEASPDEQGENFVEDVTKQVETLDSTPGANLDEQKPPYRPIFMSSNAITLSGKVQLIVRFFGEPEEIHKNYDFVHCTSYWKSWDGELVTPVEALQAILSKELRYVGSKYPLCSIIRIRKFVAQGWTINAGQILKMVFQLQEFDLKNSKVLEDQMIGVDAAYFAQVLGRLQEKGDDRVDSTYLMTIIDRIF